ncbi:MAG TPA: ATP-binding protein [Actinomycetota bacterium]|nr:ATP-binding protein [Actinomycetota bacterium]
MEAKELTHTSELEFADSARLRLLIADAQVDVRRLISMTLIGSRFEVVAEAQDGVEAVMQAIPLKPDIVLIDLDLPKLDGASTAGILRAAHPDAVIVALAADDAPAPSWADAFVLKEEMALLRTALERLEPVARVSAAVTLHEADSGPPANYEFVAAAVRAISSDLDPEHGFRAFASLVSQMVAFEALSLYGVKDDVLQGIASFDQDCRVLTVPEECPIEGSRFQKVIAARNSDLAERAERLISQDGSSTKDGSSLLVPLVRNGEVFSVIEVLFSEETGPDSLEVLSIKRLAPAITQAVLNMLAYQELREKAAVLERADGNKKSLMSLFAHDLRIPLSVVSGFAGALKQHWNSLPEGKRLEAVDAIHRNSRNLAAMIDEGFEIVMAEAGELEFESVAFNLGELTKTVANDFAGTIATEVRVHIPSHLPLVCGDARKTWRVIANLVTNAIKYGEGSPVRLVVKNMDHEVQVSVIDQGNGIKASDLNALFDKHHRLPEAEESGASGIGMGLYGCKVLIEGQRGRIWVESERFEGSTFTFTLPASYDEAAPNESDVQAPEPSEEQPNAPARHPFPHLKSGRKARRMLG